MTERRVRTRAEALAIVEAHYTKIISDYLGRLQADTVAGHAEPPPKPPGPGLVWERCDDVFVAREAARLSTWKQAEMARFTRFLDSWDAP